MAEEYHNFAQADTQELLRQINNVRKDRREEEAKKSRDLYTKAVWPIHKADEAYTQKLR